MARKLPPLSGLRTFVVAARTCSFAEAAEELCLTPAAVSRSIRSLEDFLGCSLFHRLHREVTLTEQGHYYFGALEGVFDQISAATQELLVEREESPLVVCAFPSFMTRWLIPRLASFRKDKYAFDLRLITTLTHRIDFERNNVDVAILTDSPEYSGCSSEEIFTTELVPVCRPGLLPNGLRPNEASEWKKLLLHSDTRPNDWSRWASRNVTTEFDPSAGQHFESSNLMYEAAISGLGIGIGLKDTLTRELQTGALTPAFPGSRPAECPVFLVRPATTDRRPGFRKFRNWIMKEAQQSFGGTAPVH
ncbi:MAG: LysR family transcriptional regulator [Hyphomicrobiaceae bacterium]|nr:LysR family transcriptional regulator [Hyphomicrobiaceae bacterium]